MHDHGPGLGAASVKPGDVKRLRAAVAVLVAMACIEFLVARVAGSLALASDAGHLLTDAAALGLTAFAVKRAHRPSSASHTYGYHRSGIVVAAVNGATLCVVAVAIAVGAVIRIQHAGHVDPGPVALTATVALIVNVGLAALVAPHAGELATRSALLHILADAVASVGVIAAAAVIAISGWAPADALISIVIALLIAVGAFGLVREATGILSEAVPRDIDVVAVRDVIAGTPGIDGVHDLHIWALDRSHRALSAHVEVHDQALVAVTAIIRGLEARLCSDFAIEHVTLQPECPACEVAGAYCDFDERHAAHTVGTPATASLAAAATTGAAAGLTPAATTTSAQGETRAHVGPGADE